MGMVWRWPSSLRLSCPRLVRLLEALLKNSLTAALGRDVGHGAGKENLSLAFQNVKGGGTEVSFAADDFPGLETSLHQRFLIELQESAGDILEDRQM